MRLALVPSIQIFSQTILAFALMSVSAQAGNLVLNGEFSLFSASCGGAPAGGSNQVLAQVLGSSCGNSGAVLQNWTNSRPFAAVYGPNASELVGASGLSSNLFLWGPKNGASNNFDDQSPNQMGNAAANFLADDSDPSFSGTFSQTIAGLVQGQEYELSYYWAAAQFTDETGPTSSGWTVSLGTQSLVDGTIGTGLYASIPSKGFSGWHYESLTFTYEGGPSDLLSFLAVGSPTGQPPVALLDSVSLEAAPEPASLSIVGVCLFGLVFVRLRSFALRSRPLFFKRCAPTPPIF